MVYVGGDPLGDLSRIPPESKYPIERHIISPLLRSNPYSNDLFFMGRDYTLNRIRQESERLKAGQNDTYKMLKQETKRILESLLKN